MISSELVMYEFYIGYKARLVKLTLDKDIYLIKIYVDDLNQGCRLLPYGTEYHNGKLFCPGLGWTGRAQNNKKLAKVEKSEIEDRANRKALFEYSLADIYATLEKSETRWPYTMSLILESFIFVPIYK